MRLLLSSEALPAGAPAELTRACRRRAFAGLELEASEVRGVSTLNDLGVPVPWLRLGGDGAVPEAVAAARLLGAGLLLSAPAIPPPEGVPCAVVHGTDPDEAARAAAWAGAHGAGTAWQVAPGATPAQLAEVFERTRPTLAHVRLLRADPEAGDAGPAADLMVRLALSGYAGTLALAPAAGADPALWPRWLFTSRSWGCGTAHERKARAHAARTSDAA